MTLPPADRVSVQLCSVLTPHARLGFADAPRGTHVEVTLCETAGLVLLGAGTLVITDSVVEVERQPAGLSEAVRADAGELTLERVSVGGDVLVRALEASETIFDGAVVVEDRFRGCVRYSRVPDRATLPRLHRVAVGTPIRLVSNHRRDPAWWRLRADADPAIARGAESGSEMGAFGLLRSAERMAGFEQRLTEFTPAGLVSGIVRIE
jgi:hypothetical protein